MKSEIGFDAATYPKTTREELALGPGSERFSGLDVTLLRITQRTSLPANSKRLSETMGPGFVTTPTRIGQE